MAKRRAEEVEPCGTAAARPKMIGSRPSAPTAARDALPAPMHDLKTLALQACDSALAASVQTAVSNLLLAFAQASTDDDRKQALERHRIGLQLCKTVHAASAALIAEVFAQT